MTTPGIAIILYTVREPAQVDLPGTLKRVREAGFEYVQWSGMPPMAAADIRRHLEDAGLTAMAAHCPFEPFELDFDGQVAYWQTVGAMDVAPGGMMDDCVDSIADWRRGAARLNAVGAKLREKGMRFSYHNHHWEFTRYPEDDRYKLDLLYQETSPENVHVELDVGWVQHARVNPADYLRKYAGRCPVIHVKDIGPQTERDGAPDFKPLGQGVVEWDSVLAAAKESEVEWLVYEQDTHDGDPLENVRISYEFLASKV
jgi:sugar phosphate isomerase/epimerase